MVIVVSWSGAGLVAAATAESPGAGLEPIDALLAWQVQPNRMSLMADNKIARNAGWDTELLKLELGELAALDVDLSASFQAM